MKLFLEKVTTALEQDAPEKPMSRGKAANHPGDESSTQTLNATQKDETRGRIDLTPRFAVREKFSRAMTIE